MKWFLTACALLAIAAVPAVAVDCPGSVKNAAQVSVTLDFDAGKIKVDPDSVTIYLKEGKQKPGRVCWVVQNLGAGQTVHIAGKEGQPDFFPNGEKTMTPNRPFANSGNPARAGKWLYGLWLTEEGKEGKLLVTDPEIIVDNG